MTQHPTQHSTQDASQHASRRAFVGTSLGAGLAAGLAVPAAFSLFTQRARAQVEQDAAPKLKIAVIGCGGRGTGAMFNAIEAGKSSGYSVEVVALGDLFADRVVRANEGLVQAGMHEVSAQSVFTGFDAYKRVCASDCDVVILATPPGFRSIHFAAAVDAHKHVFTEKPVAVDGPGIRRFLAAAVKSKELGLKVVAGTQRRHERSYIEAMERIHRGDIGKVIAARCYWNMGSLWNVAPDAAKSDVENQVRNWLYHSWLSGDHIVEQHVHQLDVMQWVMQADPVLVRGVGGRQARTDTKLYGHIFDHFGLEYVYPGDRFVLSLCRQQDGTDGKVEEIISGSEGVAELTSGSAVLTGAKAWKFAEKQTNPYVQEHIDLQNAIRNNIAINEGERVAKSTLVAIMGRMAAYSGKDVTWDQALYSTEELMPETVEFGPRPAAAVAVPGVAH
ncbi:MAG: Gfo/Idh/MocA family oxidoreductase [Phycisphaerales bacterium]|nr:Gfo/Idh/MocA family oxidoreductase [Phycisphaerales bacterium]